MDEFNSLSWVVAPFVAFGLVAGFVALGVRACGLPVTEFARLGSVVSAAALDKLLRRFSAEGVSFRLDPRAPWLARALAGRPGRGAIDVYVRSEDLARARRIWDECFREFRAEPESRAE